MTLEQLQEEFVKLIETRTELNVKHQSGQLKETDQIKKVRRKIADLKRQMHNISDCTKCSKK